MAPLSAMEIKQRMAVAAVLNLIQKQYEETPPNYRGSKSARLEPAKDISDNGGLDPKDDVESQDAVLDDWPSEHTAGRPNNCGWNGKRAAPQPTEEGIDDSDINAETRLGQILQEWPDQRDHRASEKDRWSESAPFKQKLDGGDDNGLDPYGDSDMDVNGLASDPIEIARFVERDKGLNLLKREKADR
ncbi:hypothetical protein NA57DRAFT_74890 [Rhizodiscina lignyota]|uniref:Uncharacterized protein n=1 Tax=Rhizodiscina lignyota TaxID=1504668 RepID=A0A9P4IEF2_9PEZI|nr:hypothetical protein NA57DRAFT_74890 [Rhizodiscina lignyota]